MYCFDVYYLGFYVEKTIYYITVVLLRTIVLHLQGLLLASLTWIPVTDDVEARWYRAFQDI